MRFRNVAFDEVDWKQLNSYDDRTYSQRRAWLEYLMHIGAGRPVIAVLEDGNREAGWFSGMRTSRGGLPVMGSPLPGWNTANMGLNLKPDVPRADAMRALSEFAFRKQLCLYLELADPGATVESAEAAGYSHSVIPGYISDLGLSEDELFNRMDPACRRCIRKAAKEGVVIEEARPDGFAAEYYSQLSEVFLRQALRPTYSQKRVRGADRPRLSLGRSPAHPGQGAGWAEHRDGHIPGFPGTFDVLGQCQRPEHAPSKAQPAAALACHAVLEEPRHPQARLGRHRRLQEKLRGRSARLRPAVQDRPAVARQVARARPQDLQAPQGMAVAIPNPQHETA